MRNRCLCVESVSSLLLGTAIAVVSVGLPWSAQGQDQQADAERQSGQQDSADGNTSKQESSQPGNRPSGTPGDSGRATRQFEDKLQEWKEIIKQLRAVKVDFSNAPKDQVAALQARWDELFEQGEAMIPELRNLGIKAYQAAPNEDLGLIRFLVKILDDDIDRDDYPSAAKLAGVLIEHDCGINHVYNSAGIAAFSTNDFSAAEEYLDKADELNALDDKGREFRGLLSDYQAFWEEEQKLREQEAKADDLPRVRIQTNKGDIVVELFENEAPQTVANFISLVEKDFYDGLTFHRVLKGFMAQTGCPIGDGTGDAGYNIYCECQDGDYRKHFRGSLSMAHAGLNTGGSQFFITFRPTDHLNGKHTVFGRVIEGLDVLTEIQRRDPDGSPPLPEPDKIIKAEVIRKRSHEYVPTKVEN